jgi:hypothetical protein
MNVDAGSLGRGRRAAGVHVLGFLVGVGIAVALALAALWLTRSSSGAQPEAASEPPPVLSIAAFEETTGVRVTQVAVTGGGGLVDLRFQVLDPDKAGAVHSPETPPMLIHEPTGFQVSHLVMNHSHKGPFKAGVTYYLIFYNSGDVVLRGDTVTVQLGEARLAHVPVR